MAKYSKKKKPKPKPKKQEKKLDFGNIEKNLKSRRFLKVAHIPFYITPLYVFN